jgi:hypothetical protein
MTKRQRRRLNPEEKVKILRLHLLEQRPVNELLLACWLRRPRRSALSDLCPLTSAFMAPCYPLCGNEGSALSIVTQGNLSSSQIDRCDDCVVG